MIDEKLRTFLKERAFYLEKQRIKAIRYNHLFKIVKPLRKILKFVLITLVIINLIIPILIPLTVIVGIIYFLLWFVNDPKEVFESTLKEDVLPSLFKHINETYNYSAYGYNQNSLQNSEILSKGYFINTVEIEGEDYVSGKIENIEVEFFEIKFYKEKINYVKTARGCLLALVLLPVFIIISFFDDDNQLDEIFDGPVKDTNVFFSGFFMLADFHKEFNGKIMMIPKNKDRIKDKFNELLEPKNLTKLTVENAYINDNYNIYASNIQTGFYVLSQNLIDKIHTLAEKENTLPIISFINGKMYFIIPWNKNFFKVNLLQKIEDENYFLTYIQEINEFEKIVKDLNLDTRIWSKV